MVIFNFILEEEREIEELGEEESEGEMGEIEESENEKDEKSEEESEDDDDDEDENKDDEDENKDDDDVMDKKLAEIINLKRREKKEEKAIKQQEIHYKIKIIDILEYYFMKNVI